MAAAKEEIPKFSITTEGKKGNAVRLTISGHLGLDNLLSVQSELENFLSRMEPASLTVDLAGVEYLDSAAALALLDLKGEAGVKSIPFDFINAGLKTKGVMGLVNPESVVKPPLRSLEDSMDFFSRLGTQIQKIIADFYDIQSFLGELLLALAYSFRHPGSVRWMDVFYYMKRIGVDALIILSLMSLGNGGVIAFLSSFALQSLGGTIFLPGQIAISVVQELAPTLTATLVAGRSGSAFAAEIGTMIVKEEVEALIAMGFDPLRFIVVPKLLAIVVVLPLLFLYSMFFCIFGGFLVGVSLLDFTAVTYINETMKSIVLYDLSASLLKSVIFALMIAVISCQRGFRVRGGAEAVGIMTTSAVVTSFFFIIFIDLFFAIALHYIRPETFSMA